MPRMKQIAKHQELDELVADLQSAPILYVKTRFLVHERVETEAMKAFVVAQASKTGDDESQPTSQEFAALAKAEGIEPCPCCGSLSARLVETVDDLEVLINADNKGRRNRWEQTGEDLARFDAIKAQAQPYGTPMAQVWHVPIDFTCSREAMHQIRDDRTRCIYWSGGWRSSKSHTASQWFVRNWVLRGSRGQLFWIVGPELKTAYRLMERIFMGRGETNSKGWQFGRSVAPKYYDPELKTWRSQIARGLPAHEKVQNMQFQMVDGSVMELRHTKSVTALEGESVRTVLYDEAIRSNGPEGFEILLGRVSQGGGQLGIASLPGEEIKSWWLYEKVVQPAESGQATDKRVHNITTYDNLWMPWHEVVAGEKSQGDDEKVQRYIYGQWNKAGGHAYSGAWNPKVMAPMGIMDAHSPESWGFKYDVTKQVASSIWGSVAAKDIEYLGGRDFNGSRAGGYHAGIICKIFGDNPLDPKTWAIVVLDEHVAKGDARAAAKDFTEKFRGGKYKEITGVIGDRMGFVKGHVYSGKASESTDAYEFETRGVLMEPPMRTEKKEPWYPGVPESKKLVRKLMEPGAGKEVGRILVDGQVCKHMVTALPQVKAGEKSRRDDGTRYDKTIACWDDCLRYLAWRLFSDELPGPKRKKKVFRTNAPRLGASARM